MLEKINDYKGVIIFYILLSLILIGMSYRSHQIDTHSSSNNIVIEKY